MFGFLFKMPFAQYIQHGINNHNYNWFFTQTYEFCITSYVFVFVVDHIGRKNTFYDHVTVSHLKTLLGAKGIPRVARPFDPKLKADCSFSISLPQFAQSPRKSIEKKTNKCTQTTIFWIDWIALLIVFQTQWFVIGFRYAN